jgi:hypothetical protein
MTTELRFRGQHHSWSVATACRVASDKHPQRPHNYAARIYFWGRLNYIVGAAALAGMCLFLFALFS